MLKSITKKLPIIYGIILILIILGFIYLRHQVKNARPIIYHQSESDSISSGDLGAEMVISKGWLESFGVRANQYDATVQNNTPFPIVDWEVTFNLPPNSEINDSWSGDYVIDPDGTVKVTGLEYNYDIEPGECITFGFILFSGVTTDINEFTIKGTPIYRYTHFALFWVLCVLSLVWLIAVCSSLSVRIMSIYYKRRREIDRQIIVQSIKTFTNFIDAKDTYTNGHSSRVAQYSRMIASHMDFTEEELDNIYYTALLHDVGKMSIPDAILNKPAKLTPEERKVIETHTTQGAEMLKDFSAIQDIVSGALYHHERYDGNGYPQGLKGEDIPLIARIICVADSYDAMSSYRCYRDALSKEAIMNELDVCAGKQFDPEIAAIMLDLIMSDAVSSEIN